MNCGTVVVFYLQSLLLFEQHFLIENVHIPWLQKASRSPVREHVHYLDGAISAHSELEHAQSTCSQWCQQNRGK
ncbi:hypothetical protein GWI33_018971 [Rhynchophorus ferrugineus]|uniref:Secreted protein n=1 Tax=Rhynchophorus ferrugineus TaxID=354439 RepID=A0A834HVC7_RHYFE|nr:hypothetical protein GWI33_018971 [Rhynchophorus ferrugineus]